MKKDICFELFVKPSRSTISFYLLSEVFIKWLLAEDSNLHLRLHSIKGNSRSSRPEVFVEISQNSQENTCARVFFNKVLGLRPATLLKKILWYRCFPVNFSKFLRTLFFYRTPSMAASVNACTNREIQLAYL